VLLLSWFEVAALEELITFGEQSVTLTVSGIGIGILLSKSQGI